MDYQDHLRKTQPDWETRWENVKELITFAKEVEEQNARDNAVLAENQTETLLDVEYALERSAYIPDTELSTRVSALRQFLQVSMLSSAGDNESEESNQEVRLASPIIRRALMNPEESHNYHLPFCKRLRVARRCHTFRLVKRHSSS